MNMKNRSRLVLPLAVIALCCSLGFIGFPVSHVYAAEGGGNHYPGGNEDFMAGALPPPGTFTFLNYIDFFNSHALNNNSGSAQRTAGPPGHQVPAGFDLAVIAESPRFVWVSKTKLLGGDLIGHVIIPLLNEHAAAFGATGTKTGLGDMEAGMGIAWHVNKNFHHVFAVDVVAPTGQYNKNDVVNLGRNYWSLNPLWAFTYRADNGLEASAKLMYWINNVNSETHYVSGQEFNADYLLAWHYQKLGFGANGFYRLQTTNDKQNGHTAVDPFTLQSTGYKASYWSIGPAITYDLPKGCITLKYQFGVEAKNVPLGNSAWLKFVWVF
jgi:hypothetical protein